MIYIAAIKDLELTAEQIVNECNQLRKWFMTNKTNSLKYKIKRNDKILIYKSGFNGKYLLGEFTILGEVEPNDMNCNDFFKTYELQVKISEIKIFSTKLYLKKLVEDLSFIKNKKNYGGTLQKGYAKVPDEDYQLIIKHL